MRLRPWLPASLAGLMCTMGQLPAAEPGVPCPPVIQCPPAGPLAFPAPAAPGQAAPPTMADAAAPGAGLFAAEARGTGEGRRFNPTMYGDLPAAQVRGPLTAMLPGGPVVVLTRGQPVPSQFQQPGVIFNFDIFDSNTGLISTPAGSPYSGGPISGILPLEAVPAGAGVIGLVSRGAFKITENESPRPMDRIYAAYNFFYDVNSSTNFSGSTTNVHREIGGIEKTFLDGRASLGIRLPAVQVIGDPGIRRYGFGDITSIVKYAFYDDVDTGNLMSVGLNVTVPTGANFLPQGVPDINPVVLQPWLGGIYNRGDFFLHGFTSVAVPLDERDVTLLFNDLGVGYFLFRDRDGFVRFLAPTIETHVTTPLNNRGLFRDPIGGIDIVTMTYGTTVGLGCNAWLNLGLGHPVSGPRPFALEALVQLNIGF